MKETKSLWSLVGSEEGSGNAENSGMLFLERTDYGFHYAIADGNDILRAKGVIPRSEVRPVPENHCVKDEYKPEYGAILAAIEKEELYKTEFAVCLFEGDKAEDEFYGPVNVAGKYIAVFNPDKTGDKDRYAVIRTKDDVIIDTFEDSGAAYDWMVELNRREATFFPQVNERTRPYTDVWVVGASQDMLQKAAERIIAESIGNAAGVNSEMLFTDGRIDGEALTFRTEYNYIYAGRIISEVLPGAIVFAMDSCDAFGFAAYADGVRSDDYILDLDLKGIPDTDGPNGTSYSGTITVRRKDDGKKLFTTSLGRIPARYGAGLIMKSTWSFDAAR